MTPFGRSSPRNGGHTPGRSDVTGGRVGGSPSMASFEYDTRRFDPSMMTSFPSSQTFCDICEDPSSVNAILPRVAARRVRRIGIIWFCTFLTVMALLWQNVDLVVLREGVGSYDEMENRVTVR